MLVGIAERALVVLIRRKRYGGRVAFVPAFPGLSLVEFGMSTVVVRRVWLRS
jgi:hypothetical protein